MRLVHRMVMLTFTRAMLYAVLGALILFTLVDLFEHMDNFLDNKATFDMVARYYVYKFPWIVDLVLPVSMLMSTLFTVGTMARYNELTALFASGRSLLQITRPLLLIALLASAFSLAWSEWVLPPANSARNRVWNVEVHRRPDRTRPTTDVALTGRDGRLYFARRFDPAAGRVVDFTAQTLAGSRVAERIDAAGGEWDGRQWVLTGGTRRTFDGDVEHVSPFTRLEAPFLALTPAELNQERVKPEDMNIRQLGERVRLLRSNGRDPLEYAVDLQFKLAFPAVHLIVVFLGILLASGPRKTNIASGFSWTVLVSFGYYLSMHFGRALGHSGTLPPALAGWAGNALYALVGLGLFWRARR